MTIGDRLRELTIKLNLSARVMSLAIGRDASYIRGVKGEVSTDVLRKINECYPQVNLLWLITGKGDIFDNKEENNDTPQTVKVDTKMLETIQNQVDIMKTQSNMIADLQAIIKAKDELIEQKNNRIIKMEKGMQEHDRMERFSYANEDLHGIEK